MHTGTQTDRETDGQADSRSILLGISQCGMDEYCTVPARLGDISEMHSTLEAFPMTDRRQFLCNSIEEVIEYQSTQ